MRRASFFLLQIGLSVFLGTLLALSPAALAQAPLGQTGGAEQPSYVPPDNAPKYVPDQVLVRFRTGTAKASQDAVHSALGATVLRSFHTVAGLQVVKLPPGMSVAEALRRYRTDPNVLYAEPDYILHAIETIPNDPSFTNLWAMQNTGQSGGTVDADIDATDAWTLSTGSNSVYVGVIDTGVDYNHSDLSGNMYSSATDCNTNGIDDDNDGYIDDCHGIDTANHDSNPMDDNSHGTHCAGTIGATGNNGVGVVGVNWRVTVVPCKFLKSDGSGPNSGAIECLDWLAKLKDHGLNIVATSNSYSGGAPSQASADAIKANLDRGILFIAAASNDNTNNDSLPIFPANYGLPNMVVVASTDRYDLRSSFSNYGLHTVHLGAPGSSIYSTVLSNAYAYKSGTSMATPHVAGAAALLKAQNSSLDWRAIKNLLISSGDPIAALSGKTASGRRLNVYSAMTCSNSPMYAPLTPHGFTTAAVGSAVTFSAININCAKPAGNVTVSIDSEGQTVTLRDDGANGDLKAGDGVYTGKWIAPTTGTHTYTFQGGSDTGSILVLEPYSAGTSTTYSWRSITGTNLQVSDDGVANLDLNTAGLFPIKFGGVNIDHLSIAGNGVLSFNNFGPYMNGPIPEGWTAMAFAAPWWDDLSPQPYTDQNIFYEVTGSAPGRELVIEWRNVPHYEYPLDTSKTVTFQVVFPETSSSSDILFNYSDVNFNEAASSVFNAGGSATVGVEIDPTHGTQYSYNQAVLSNGLALLFQAPATPPAITVVTPNGGESWAAGNNQTISWNYTTLTGNVSIVLLKAGAAYKTLGTVPIAPGSYLWTLPADLPVASDYKIRITSVSSPSVLDVSNSTFSVSVPPANTITVKTPAGGESWVAGSTHNIQWNYTGLSGDVHITLMKAGTTYSTIATYVPIGTGGSGSYSWTLPTTLPIASDYRIRVTSASNPSLKSYSNGMFSVTPGIQVVSPNGGESWAAGSTHNIQWKYAGLTGQVHLTLVKAGVTYSTIATYVPIGSAGSGSYSWTVPTTVPIAADYTIRVLSATTTSIKDYSDAAFSITAGIQVISPNGGESWAAGSTHNIQWKYAGLTGQVHLTLVKAGVTYRTIATYVPIGSAGSGSYTWTVPTDVPLSADYTVRVLSATMTSIKDYSDAAFSIVAPPPITVVSPNGGESWAAGSAHNIQWTYLGLTGNVNIALLKAGAAYRTIATDVSIGSAGSGSYSWTPATSLPTASDYKVQVTSASDGTKLDVSDANFTITGASITVVAPNGGESWRVGTQQLIQWNYTGSPGSTVKIELLKAGVLNSTISAGTSLGSAGSGSFTWDIPAGQVVASDYRVRVTDTSNADITDSSNANFALTSNQLLLNPGFENGSANPAPWVATAGIINNLLTQPPHTGLWNAWLDGDGTAHTDTLYQPVAIPSTATSATFSFWLHIDTAEYPSYAWDHLYVQVRDSSGVLLTTLATYSNLDANTGYALRSFDITAYKGQTIWVYFEGTEDSIYQTSFVIDDCAVNVE